LKEIFNIINEETREPVENPVEKVLSTGNIIGLANHTILITREGNEIPIDDSGSPIKNDKGEVFGVVLVFREIAKSK
jgi:diguanylate cyclase